MITPTTHKSPAINGKNRVFRLLSAAFLIILTSCNGRQIWTDSTINPSPEGTGIMNIYFTDPERIRNGTLPSEALKKAFNQAEESIDLAIYNFGDPILASALLQAKQRGVKVRLVMDDQNAVKNTPQSLQAAGISVVAGNDNGLMHNKFAIIDGQTLWMGSANFTTYGFNTDNNYFVETTDPYIINAYQAEFDEMYRDKLFGDMNMARSPQSEFTVQGTMIEVYFSPEDGIADKLVNLINNADTSVHFLTSSFTLDDMASAMIGKAAQGIEVQGVFDASSVTSNEGMEYDRLRRAGLEIRMDGIEGLMHEKLIIIDSQIIAIGSYNYTASADRRNDENIMIVHDAELADIFENEFQRIMGQSQP